MNQKINYENLLRNALISVVKKILEQVSSNGFDNKQHLYITFSLKHPSVKVSDAIREEFKDEITIVLQYEFWDLIVDDYGFSVSLAFDKSDECIYVPFASLININDPSEDFNLDFIPNLDVVKIQQPIEVKTNDSKIISLDAFRKNH